MDDKNQNLTVNPHLVHPGVVPSTPILWPSSRQVRNQVQQTKGSAKPQAANVLPTTQPSVSSVPPRTTPGQVSNVRVITRAAVNGQKTVTVQFQHPASSDPYFQGASVYLRRAGQPPTQVASGNKSPLTFTVPVSHAAHSIHVTSWGPWGETNASTAPGHPVRLV